MPMQITNTRIYTVPSDSESDSDYEDYKVYTPKTRFLTQQQESQLISLGCVYNAVEDYKRSHLYKNPKVYDQQFASNMQQHQSALKKDIEHLLTQQRQQQQQELDRLKSMLSAMNVSSSKDDQDDDKAFEDELNKQRKLIDDAIAIDKKKSENATAEAEAKAKAKAAKEKQEQEEKEKKEQQAKELKEKKAQQLEMQKIAQSSAVSPQGLQEYKKYFEKIEFYKTTIRPKLQNDVFRKQCFQAKLVIKRTVSQLQADHRVITEKFNTLNNHLLGIKQQSPEAFEYMLNQLAKFLLTQAKQEIHATAFAAYFLARFAYLMCSSIPDFLPYLMGRLLKRCPYLIPQYHDDDPSLSHDEIKSRLRYAIKNKEKKTLETFLEHAEGQRCFVMFYGALCQTLPDPGQPENPFPIKHAWVWLARVCNMPPREITPILVHGLLEVSAVRLLQAYPHQTPKLFRLIRETICPLYPASSGKENIAGIKRLEMFLDDYFRTGQPECVPEKLPPTV
ncbi:GLE1-like protein-domain-containing protein [Mucor lusitanicus]|uniref:mRNA export factor GLE1 n=2 Tax=Mucor circinelloides f. lusitanicus TaxID=29924 RepID=A0A162ZIV4_MUCCL|nr:GLE1-like protein-domain-containing protein [Mucor lusitanicus]OAD06467.1 hypothetical protein MUCCIDRAFT_78483 [Mucor lusitanicus CBS 277.49]